MRIHSQARFGLLTLATLLSLVASVFAWPSRASAQQWNCPDGRVVHGPYVDQAAACAAQGGGSGGDEQAARVSATCQTAPVTASNCPFLQRYIVPAINALAASVGIVVVIMVAWGGLQYASSRDNPQQAAAAKGHIRDALLALVIYIFMVAFLNWLVPGGVF